jgi:hypothetical protein
MNDKADQFNHFSDLVAKVLSVPKAEILRREAEYRKGVEANLNRRGPKRKIKSSSVSLDSAVS